MKEIFRLTLILTVITAVSAGVLAFVNQQTEQPIENALREEKMKALRNVLPPFDNELTEDSILIPDITGDTLEVFRGKEDGKINGVAFPVLSHDGYSGDIEFMVGVNLDGVIQGIEILTHTETPGLGAKIQSEDFKTQFKTRGINNPELWEVEKDGGVFKQITGATISSRAVTRAVHKGLKFYKKHIDEITGRENTGSESQKGNKEKK